MEGVRYQRKRKARPFLQPRQRPLPQRLRYRSQQLRAAQKQELKFHDVDIDDAVIATGMNVQTALLTIPEGVGEEQRIGRRLTITNILWRYTVTLPFTTLQAETSDVVRVMLIKDQQANGALPANTDLLESDDFQSFNNLSNSKRFSVLMDKTHDIAA